jgi:hypothetical protein
MLHFGITVGNAISISGPDRLGLVWGHYAKSFKEYKHFRQVVIIRRPLERLCSLYRLHRKHESTINFGEYLHKLAGGEFAGTAIHDNQDTFLRDVKEDIVLHMCNDLDPQLIKLGLMPSGYRVDRKNASLRRDVPNAASIGPIMVERLRDWWEPDCKRFSVELR